MKSIFKMLLWITACLTAVQVISAQDMYKKTISETFDIKPFAAINLQHKFGDIYCENWEEDKVSIEVVMQVSARSQEKADGVFDDIEVEINGDEDQVQVGISYQKQIWKSNNDLQVDYYIKMPRAVELTVESSYGSVSIEEVYGNSDIEIAYGELSAARLDNESRLDVKYSSARIRNGENFYVDLKYSELKLSAASQLSIDTKYSSLKVGNIPYIELDSGYDDVYIEETEVLVGQGDFGNVKIDDLHRKLDLNANYGELEVNTIYATFDEIKIDMKNGIVKLDFEAGTSYLIDAEIKYGNLKYPKNATLSKNELSVSTAIYKGRVGPEENNKYVQITAQYTDVSLY